LFLTATAQIKKIYRLASNWGFASLPWRGTTRAVSLEGKSHMLFLLQAQYTAESMRALIQNPVDRTPAVTAAIESLGGRLTGLWNTSGGDRQGVLIIYDLPDTNSQYALTSTLIASDAVRDITTQRLYTAEEGVKALHAAQNTQKLYEPPAVRRS
jgi:uncharacterized protein with GYD domain